MGQPLNILSEEFVRQVIQAGNEAVREALAAGVPVFYRHKTGMEVMEMPDGRLFEISYIPGAPGDRNYEVLRQVASSAA